MHIRSEVSVKKFCLYGQRQKKVQIRGPVQLIMNWHYLFISDCCYWTGQNQMLSRQLSHVMHQKINSNSKSIMPTLVNAYDLILRGIKVSLEIRTENVSYYMQLQHSPSCQWQRSMAELVISPLRIGTERQRISIINRYHKNPQPWWII